MVRDGQGGIETYLPVCLKLFLKKYVSIINVIVLIEKGKGKMLPIILSLQIAKI